MKSKMLKVMKKAVSVFVVCAIVVCGFSVTAHATTYTEDENEEMSTVYAPYTFAEFSTLKDKVPVFNVEGETNGYLFGGWFTSTNQKTFTAMSVSDKANWTEESGAIYAKFVPAYVMGVKCQNMAGTTSETGETSLKIVSSIDTPNYSSVGFEMDVITLNDDGSFNKETLIEDKTGIGSAYPKFKVYADSNATEPVETFYANQLFGKEAGYFTTWGVTKIPTSMFGTIICIRPSWTTIDGTTVYGLTKYARVNDGIAFEDTDGSYYRYLSVPVNVRNIVGGVAAGVLSVECPSGMTFAGFEGGRVFGEMAYAEKADSIKMVGNVADISKNNTEDDIYANLRFKISFSGENAESEASKTLKDYSFSVSGEDFSNIDEAQFKEDTYNVWDVKY